jgi:hypothetical protein
MTLKIKGRTAPLHEVLLGDPTTDATSSPQTFTRDS